MQKEVTHRRIQGQREMFWCAELLNLLSCNMSSQGDLPSAAGCCRYLSLPLVRVFGRRRDAVLSGACQAEGECSCAALLGLQVGQEPPLLVVPSWDQIRTHFL